MKSILPLFVFIDACGWEIVRRHTFAHELAPHRRPLRSVLGYSSACIPSILSGRYPCEHRNWCYFVHDPERSPFRSLRPLRWLPRALTGRRRVRRLLSRLVKARLGFRGYFDLYNLPFDLLPQFDFTERRSPLQPGGMNRGENVFDWLVARGIPYHVSDPARGEEGNLAALEDDVRRESIDFAFLYWPDLDGLMHRVGPDSPEVPAALQRYEARISRLMATARAHYQEVPLYVFSDHGMAACDTHVDLMSRIDALGLRQGEDYAAVYDSTMARFWFFRREARARITSLLETQPEGSILSHGELTDLGAYFPDHYFGELIYLLREGALIVPSHMGERPIRAMHGYHPDEAHSFAALLSNHSDVPAGINAIPDLYKLMVRDAARAHAANRPALTALAG